MQEWIKFHRSFLNWNWIDKPEMLVFFFHLLICASEEEKQGEISLQRGQLKTTLGVLSESTGMSKQTLRTCLAKLREWKLIQIETCARHTMITICDYDRYFEEQPLRDDLRKVKIEGEKSETSKIEKPKKTKEELVADTKKRKEKFYKELIPYVETFGKKMIRNFFDYWSEMNKSGSRMRFEQERTWNLNLRLQRWGRQQTGYSKSQIGTILHNSEDKDYNEGGW